MQQQPPVPKEAQLCLTKINRKGCQKGHDGSGLSLIIQSIEYKRKIGESPKADDYMETGRRTSKTKGENQKKSQTLVQIT